VGSSGVGGGADSLSGEHPSSLSGAELLHLVQTTDGGACLDELPLPQVDFEVINGQMKMLLVTSSRGC